MGCKTITISTCPPTGTCDACKEVYNTDCVIYKGDSLPALGIVRGDTLSEILTKLNTIIDGL